MVATDDTISLREYVDMRFEALERAVETQRLEAQRAIDKALKGVEETNRIHAEAHKGEHTANQTAIQKAEESMTNRLAGMNEFRAALNDAQRLMLSKAEYIPREEALRLATERNADDIKTINAYLSNLQGRIWAVGAAFALVVVLIGYLVNFS